MFKTMPVNAPKNQEGLSLLEVIISIAVVSLAITALVTISNAAIASVDSSRNQAIADQYARQDLEAARVNRDQSGWNSFLQVGQTPPATPMAVGVYSEFSINGTQMIYQAPMTASQAAADQCANIKNQTYAISGASGFYQYVVLYRQDTHTMKVSANVCYGYRGTTHRILTVQTLLSDWQ